MKTIRSGLPFYTVVEVTRGVATGARCFRLLRDARLYAERLRQGRNLQEDDVQVFKSRVDSGHRWQ